MNGFTDLRPNIHYQSQNAEESFWPSFTDLMMVVVMIFLVTTSALYIRNWQLVQEMSSMIESERMAREMAQQSLAQQSSKDAILEKTNAELIATSEDRNNLQMSLFEAKESLRALQMMRNALQTRNTRQTTELSAANADKDQLLAQLNAQIQRAESTSAELVTTKDELLTLEQAQASSGQSIEKLTLDVDAANDQLALLRADHAALQGKYDETLSAEGEDKSLLLSQLDVQTQRANSANEELAAARAEILALQQAQVNSGQSIDNLQVDFDATTDRLVQLRADYVVLQGKYNKLLKPARSPQGRYVVTLRHGKANSELYYDFRLPTENTYTRVTEANMHERLAEVLAEQGDLLYLQLVYPKSSGLSYDEAFQFSNSVLNEYDYYYRNEPLDE